MSFEDQSNELKLDRRSHDTGKIVHSLKVKLFKDIDIHENNGREIIALEDF